MSARLQLIDRVPRSVFYGEVVREVDFATVRELQIAWDIVRGAYTTRHGYRGGVLVVELTDYRA